MESYKASKEAFVSDTTGTTLTHVNAVSAVALSSVALYSALQTRLPSSKPIQFPIAFLILVIPFLLSATVLANSPIILSVVLLVPTGFLILAPSRDASAALPASAEPSSRPEHSPTTPIPSNTRHKIEPLPALTTYRAHMMLFTILCILAVDFPVFPRVLAKCETFGVSLMDIGVGAFVFSQGTVSAIPLIQDPSYLDEPISRKLPEVVRKILPVLFLGLVRVVLVKGTEYPEHVSEYGVHWNFFLTLGLLPVIQIMLHPFIAKVPLSLLGFGVAVAHQGSLFFGLEDFVINAPRLNLVSANKEGIVSLGGYLAIHLLGLSTGTLILPPSPSWFRRRQEELSKRSRRRSDPGQKPALSRQPVVQRQNDKTATELFSYAVVWWVLLGILRFYGVGTDVSRRMANLPYVLWVAAYNVSFILGYLLLDLYFFPTPLSVSIYSPTSKLKVSVESPAFPIASSSQVHLVGNPPPLFEAINKNSLVIFLVANVVTGLVNLSMQTMYTSDFWAMVVLTVYSFTICGLAWAGRGRRIWRL
ncbi:hypothetical protein HGRIS_012283 [Hohenbuehelia grisea]|uniref:GPI-anchored wall transfer protein n=1 Tax=Hohenbuehelia grisea TaxID=104357 RepID=A0ABR3IRS5_9AGAR